MTKPEAFDPYALFEALDRNRVSYVVVGGFARVVHGSAETTRGLDVVPSLREENLRRLGRALGELGAGQNEIAGEPLEVRTATGVLKVVPMPWGTGGYEELRRRANRENLGRGARPQIASVVDLARMLEVSEHPEDSQRLHRLRRLMELERQRTRRRGLVIER